MHPLPPRHRTITEELAHSPLHILLVSGDAADHQLIAEALQRGKVGHFLVEAIHDSRRALPKLVQNLHDVCLLTHQLQPDSGLELLRQAREQGCELPVVMISASLDHELDMAAMERGAADYLPREELNAVTLERTIRYSITHVRLQRELRQLARLDPLTGLCNRRGMTERLQRGLDRARRSETMLALLVVDLDQFKTINDELGHQAGDRVIRQVSRRLSKAVRSTDTVCRMGGDEFALILEGLASREDAARVADDIVHRLEQPLSLPRGLRRSVRASVGVSFFPHDGDSIDELLRRADQAMYRAKRSGGGRSVEWESAING